ncbi:phage tail length tape measure family protein [Cereibacter azotoformans]|uniref:Tail length tape measure protein n=1 Tax=Cereibacter azotoformans TaxID=43057 RepID=A0A2T5JSD3_9RHOB|nr:phage tail length tape measure family protein [Cereibacter azotoformans]MBO4168868.1 phage tail length tape measure family protein [Cereibacter azotoformans]PTR11144.1 tail length tape measure protein [Cereibacter azotoformans]
MSLRLSLLIDANAKGAKTELDATAGAAKKLTTQVDQLGKEAARTRTQLGGVQNQTAPLGRGMELSAGAVGNLTAQFNDIGMMLMAGQNPLMLAVQQGTQITQVIGPMGAAGAVRTLGAAFMSLLSPVNLVTLGVIAGGAALIQWLTGASAEARTLEDAVGDLSGHVDAYGKASRLAHASAAELTKEFGTQAVVIRELLKQLAEVEKRSAERSARSVAQSLAQELQVNIPRYDIGDQVRLADFFDLSIWSRQARGEINAVLNALSALDRATTLDQQIAAGQQLGRAFREAAEASGTITEAEDEILKRILEATREAVQFKDEQLRAGFASSGLADIMKSIQWALSSAGDTNLAKVFSDANGPANLLLFKANAIWAALTAAAKKLQDIEGDAVMSPPEPPRIDGNPGANTFSPIPDTSGAPSRSPRPRSAPSSIIDSGLPPVTRGAGRGGGVSAIEKQRKALDELLRQEQLALDLARESDPLQKEMIRNRDVLAAATDAERAKVEQLIGARIREEEAARTLQETWDFLGQTAFDALGAMIVQGKSASDVIASLASSLASAALQSMFLGTGPLAGFFGTAAGGGIFGAMAGGVKKAGGGLIQGPGTGTSDSIAAWLSNGEFVINAASTAAWRPVLEAINADRSGSLMRQAPRFAAGGMVGGARAAALARSGGTEQRLVVDLRLSQDLDARIESRSSEVALNTVRAGLDQFNRNVLPGRVQQINADPRKKA